MGTTARSLRGRSPRPVVYPTRDGRPMGETERHVNLIIYGVSALRAESRPQNRKGVNAL
jgi:hypothetical protein